MIAREANIVVIDFETTGRVGRLASEPWQIGMVSLVGGRLAADVMFDSFLRIGDRPFNPYAPGRHAQIRAQLRSAPTLPELWPQLSHWVQGRPLGAHNVATERKILREAFPLHVMGPWIDTLKLVRIAYPGLANHKLGDIIQDLDMAKQVGCLCPGRSLHDALYDAVACAVLLEHLLSLPGWERRSLEALARVRAKTM